MSAASRRWMMVLIDAENPKEAADTLLLMSHDVRRGICFEQADKYMIASARAHEGDANGEIGFAARYHAVGYDGETIRPPVALFRREVDALAFASGGVYQHDEDKPDDHGIVFRADVVGLAWNSVDPDPVPADEASTRDGIL